MYVTPKSPKGWHKNAISLFGPVKFNFCRKKSATKFLCMKTSSGKVVATSFPYPTVHRSIALGYNSAESEPIWMKSGAFLEHCRWLALADFGCDRRSSDSWTAMRIFICQLSNTRFHRFPVGEISPNLNTARRSVRRRKLSNRIVKFTIRGRFKKNAQISF